MPGGAVGLRVTDRDARLPATRIRTAVLRLSLRASSAAIAAQLWYRDAGAAIRGLASGFGANMASAAQAFFSVAALGLTDLGARATRGMIRAGLSDDGHTDARMLRLGTRFALSGASELAANSVRTELTLTLVAFLARRAKAAVCLAFARSRTVLSRRAVHALFTALDASAVPTRVR